MNESQRIEVKRVSMLKKPLAAAGRMSARLFVIFTKNMSALSRKKIVN